MIGRGNLRWISGSGKNLCDKAIGIESNGCNQLRQFVGIERLRLAQLLPVALLGILLCRSLISRLRVLGTRIALVCGLWALRLGICILLRLLILLGSAAGIGVVRRPILLRQQGTCRKRKHERYRKP